MVSPTFNRVEQHFVAGREGAGFPSVPLTATLQVTRGCNLKCIYCSESTPVPPPNLRQIETMLDNLSGVPRLIVSGGEPVSRPDLPSILGLCRSRFGVVALASNATKIDRATAEMLSRYVDYVDVTIDGPRAVHNSIRGSYDQVMQGLWSLKQAGVEISVVTVLVAQNEQFMPFVAHAADVLGAKKLKVLTPIPKGRGRLLKEEILPRADLSQVFGRLRNLKQQMGWTVRITVTDWRSIGEGHALLVHPNGDVVASPVWSKESCIEKVGNVLEESVAQVWARYPYKENHMKKYTEQTLMVC